MSSSRRNRLALPRDRRRPRWWTARWVFPLLLLLTLAGATAWTVGLNGWQGWNVRPDMEAAARDQAMARLRTGHGPAWLPERAAMAEALSRRADQELVRQDARHERMRDYRAARDLLGIARHVADVCDRAAARTEADLRVAAEQAIRAAEPRVHDAVTAAELVRLTAQGRRRLEHARLALEEARVHAAAGRHPDAIRRAEDALELAGHARTAAVERVRRFADPDQRRDWALAVEETVEWSRKNPGRGAIVVNKEARSLTVFVGGNPVVRMRAELGKAGMQPKHQAGDDATPEGRYKILQMKSNGQSRYYKALLLDYPNETDRRRFDEEKRTGRIRRNARLGGLIEIHGHGGKGRDWTHGCVAVTNDEMDELFRRVGVGSPVTIVGSAGQGGSLTDLARPARRGRTREAP